MIVVVINCKPSINGGRGFTGKIETIQPTIAVVDEGAAILGPVRRLKRVSRRVDNSSISRSDIHQLKIAADVLAVRHKIVSGGNSDPNVTKHGLLSDVLVVGTD